MLYLEDLNFVRIVDHSYMEYDYIMCAEYLVDIQLAALFGRNH